MKITALCAVSFLLSTKTFVPENSDFIKGILHSDQELVAINTSHGRISKIVGLSKEFDVHKVYVAPGLIDIQINGYVGVDFSGPRPYRRGCEKSDQVIVESWGNLLLSHGHHQ